MAAGPRLIAGADGQSRCWWCGNDPLYVKYHDREWGFPVDDDMRLTEILAAYALEAVLA